MPLADKQSSPVVADDSLRLSADFPPIPQELIDRFESATQWGSDLDLWWRKNQQAINDFSGSVMDRLAMGGVLTVDGTKGSIYIRDIVGEGAWNNADTPFFVDKDSYFSLGNKLTWNPISKVLNIEGSITADSGTIGGFEIGSDYIRDTLDSFGLSSTVTVGDDVRLWAGDTFANRASAPFRVTESGAIASTSGVIGGWTINTSGFSQGASTFLFSNGTLSLAPSSVSTNVVVNVAGTVTASSAGSRYGIFFGTTMSALANGITHIGCAIQPTFGTGGFSGGTCYGLLVAPSSSGGGTYGSVYGINVDGTGLPSAASAANRYEFYAVGVYKSRFGGALTVSGVLNADSTVGIGVSVPTQKLDIESATDFDGIKVKAGTSTAGVNGLMMRGNSGYGWNVGMGNSAHISLADKFFIYDNSAAAVRLTIDTSGSAVFGGGVNSTAIGATTPSTGAFTTLSATSTVTLTGGSAGSAGTPALFIANNKLLVWRNNADSTNTMWIYGGTDDAVHIGANSGDKLVVSSTGLAVTGGVVIGAATGGTIANSINVAGDVYKNNTAYTNPDYVLEKWATGGIIEFADNPGAKEYTGLKSLAEVEVFARSHLHLPRFGQQADHGLFSGSDALLATVEESYLYLFQHESELQALRRRVAALEARAA